jgi:hypothetical protein
MGYWSIVLPDETQNYISNPSIEIDTSGWSAIAGAITRSDTDAMYGIYCLAVTPTSSSDDGAYFGEVTLDGGDDYTFSAYIRGAAGVPYKMYFASTSGSAVGTPATFTATGVWERQEVSYNSTGSTDFRVYVTKNDSASSATYYIDAAQVEEHAYSTTYCDGNQPGCYWLLGEHASMSRRDGQSRAGGREYNLDTYNFYIVDLDGTGMAPIENFEQSRSLLLGSIYDGYRVLPRNFALIGDVIGSSRPDLHLQRKNLINAIRPDLTSTPQPFILRYRGSNLANPVEISAVYAGGLEMSTLDGFTERVAIRLTAYDPYWYEIGSRGASLTSIKSTTDANYIIVREDDDWGGVKTGFNGTVHSLVFDSKGNLYAGGAFTLQGATTVNYVAKYNGSVWSTMANSGASSDVGMNGAVNELLVDADDNVYATGAFTAAGGVAASYIAKWNGSAWEALGAGLNLDGNGLAIGLDGAIYAVGAFTTAGGSAANRVAKWSGGAWSAIDSTSLNNTAYGCVVGLDGYLYVCGSFTTAGGNTVNRISYWNGTDWQVMGPNASPGLNGLANKLSVAPNGYIYVTGQFTTAGGESSPYIARWNGTAWRAIPGLTGGTQAWAMFWSGNTLWVGGNFTSVSGDDVASSLVTLSNAGGGRGSWTHVDVDLPGSANVYAIAGKKTYYDDILYVGFDTSGTATSGYSNNVTNNSSTVKTYPKFKVSATLASTDTATLEYIRNSTTGKTIALNRDLQNGETITLDLTPGAQDLRSSAFGSLWQTLSRNSDFAQWYLLPGDNSIRVYVSYTGAPTITTQIEWRNAHWSMDGVSTG